jgi:glucokinase
MRIGIDIGGTKAHAIAIDDARTILAEATLPSGQGEAQVLANTRAAVERLLAQHPGPVESIGVGIPGNVDAATGIVAHAVNLGLTELGLAAGLADLSEGPVRVDNDVNAAALGAFSVLTEVPSSMAYLNIGTGIAAGLILDGKVWRGFRGIAGEVGHFPIERDGALCPCGQHGCLETVASGSAIVAQWKSDRPWSEAIAANDPEATALLQRVAEGIADAVQLLVLTVGVEVVALAGGVVTNTPGLVASVRESLARRSAASGFLASTGLADRLALASPDDSIPAIGAALLGSATFEAAGFDPAATPPSPKG